MFAKTPILSVKPASARRGEVLPSGAFERLHQNRTESVLSPALLRLKAPVVGHVGQWLEFARIDGSTHFCNQQGANGLPTLIPRFLTENLPVKKLAEYSCDARPHPDLLFRYYCKAATQHFGSLLSDAASAIGRLSKPCRMSICIVAASKEEQGFLARTLRCFANQTAKKDQFEIAVFLNCLDSTGRVDQKSRQTISEVEQVMRWHPDLNIRPFFAGLPDSEVWTIGRIRKLLMDAVTLRVYNHRWSSQRQHILFSTDADCVGVHPRLVEHYLHTFDQHPHVDAIRGRVDWDFKALCADPLLLLGVRLMNVLDAHRRTIEPTYGVGTPSLAMRVERYMDAGGYHCLDRVGEDMDLLARLRAIRTGSAKYTALKRGGPYSRVWTSLRRAERALTIDNTPPANMWFIDGARFQLQDAEVRQGVRAHSLTFKERLDDPSFLANAEQLTTKTIRTYAREHAESPLTQGALVDIINHRSGLDLRRDGESDCVVIGNPARLKALLLNFQDQAPPYWKSKLGFEW